MTLFRRSEVVIAAILLVAMILIGLVNPAFWQVDNLFSLLRSNVIIGIMALGVLLVMLSGGFDVSFPAFAVAAMYLTVKGMLYFGYVGVLVPFVCAILIGAACGSINAFFVWKFRMIPLIVTLGTGSMVRGFLLGVVGTSMINIDRFPPVLIDFAKAEVFTITKADGTHSGLTAMVLIYFALALGVHLMLRHTMIGRSIFALGGGAEAATRVGFDLKKTIFFIYCLAGALAGFAGMLHCSMIWLANPRDFVGTDLEVIAAVVLGGASIFGGRGSVLGTMLGVFMLVMVKNSLIIMKVDTTWQLVVVGSIIVIATAATAWRDRKRQA
ncbi:ABC transporter permease [Siculibacillus lacustris]|uniref:ABC transporter permease n=1 Tax=Siculibacillus lacustris TaxID=1549641 RepID=A0A4Q9VYA7_9HYPH|nr:ABC transporter permease [Siculibacillus lacustris]TBW41400.1 ABC transporter permease [Siculibacillus lacustris]